MKTLPLLFLFILLPVRFLLAQSFMEGEVREFGTRQPLPDVRAVLIYRNDTLWHSKTDTSGYYRIRFQRNGDLYVLKSGYQTRYYRLGRRNRPRTQLMLHRGMSGLLDTLSTAGHLRFGSGQYLHKPNTIYRSWGDQTRLRAHHTATPQALWQGRFTGMRVQHGSGLLDEMPRLRIRGTRSFYALAEPLIVLDGLPLWQTPLDLPGSPLSNPLLAFPVDDLQEVRVLKESLETSRWGARGANGVLMLSSLRDVPTGKGLRVSYRAGVSGTSVRPDMLSAQQYDELFEEAAQNAGFNADQITFFRLNNNISDTLQANWTDLPFRMGFFQQAGLGIWRRDSTGTMRADVSFRQENAHVVWHNQQRLTARLQLQEALSEQLTIQLQLGGTYLSTDRLTTVSPLSLLTQIPSNPTTDPQTGAPNPNTYTYNALFEENGTTNQSQLYRLTGSGAATYKLLSWLNLRAFAGVDFLRWREEADFQPETLRGQPDGLSYSRLVQAATARTGLDLNGVRTWSRHRLRYTFGADYQYYDADTISGKASRTLDLALRERYAFGGGHAELAYDFDSRYLLQGSLRQERATAFGSQKPWQTFGAVAVGWTVSQEAFFRKVIDKIPFLQLTAAYGTSGNAFFNPAFAQGSLAPATYGGQPALSPQQLGNNALEPERTTQLDFGFRTALFHDKIALEVSHFRQRTEGLLLNVPLPATSGYDNQWQNIGALENQGWEFTLRTHNWERFWDWFTEISLTTLQSEVTQLAGQTLRAGTLTQVREGEPLGLFYGAAYAGVDPQNGNALYLDAEGNPTANPQQAAMQPLGQAFPTLWGSIRNRFEYEWLTVDMLWEGAAGNQVLDLAKAQYANAFTTLHNQATEALDRWQQPGDITDVPQLRLFEGNGNLPSSRWLQDADYLRLKRLRVGYRLTEKWRKRFRAREAEVFVQGENLWTFTKVKHIDPEISRWGSLGMMGSQLVPNGQFFNVPTAWRVQLGLELRF